MHNIRSTSFYGLSFVRVTFEYGIDYYFALQQAQISLLQNVNLPNNVQPQIQASSLVGEIYRYQVTGPKHIGVTNLRSIQDWVLQRRFLTVPGVVQVNTWGGTTKEFEVEADLDKLEAYNVTLPQLVSAVSNANINIGGRTINIGKQSVNIRGVGLINDGGNNDLILGRRVEDIQNITLGQFNGVPVQIKDVAQVYVGNVPRLGKAGRDDDDDAVAAILVMNRTLHTNDVIPRIKAEVEKINSDGTLPPGVKLVPFYDRTGARRCHHGHRASQPHLRLPPGLSHPVDIPRRPAQRHHRRRQHPVRAVLQHHHPGAARRGRQSPVARRRRFRHHRRLGGDRGGEHLPEFPGSTGAGRASCRIADAPSARTVRHASRDQRPGPTGCG